MGLEWEQGVVDAADPVGLGRWWADALGWVVVNDDPEEFEIRPGPARLPGLIFAHSAAPKMAKNRLHLDFRPDDRDREVERLVTLGARRVDIGQGSQTWTVLADPEGNEFCVLSSRRRPDGLARRIAEVSELSGSFRLRSGQTATSYFDKYLFESDPSLLAAIARELVPLIPEGTEVLAGLELGGLPVVTALSLETGLPAAFVRKEAKSYGTEKLAEGAAVDGRRVLVVEDVVTTGGQVVLSTEELRARGALVTAALCVLDREQGGRDALAQAGIELRAAFTRSDLAGLS